MYNTKTKISRYYYKIESIPLYFPQLKRQNTVKYTCECICEPLYIDWFIKNELQLLPAYLSTRTSRKYSGSNCAAHIYHNKQHSIWNHMSKRVIVINKTYNNFHMEENITWRKKMSKSSIEFEKWHWWYQALCAWIWLPLRVHIPALISQTAAYAKIWDKIMILFKYSLDTRQWCRFKLTQFLRLKEQFRTDSNVAQTCSQVYLNAHRPF